MHFSVPIILSFGVFTIAATSECARDNCLRAVAGTHVPGHTVTARADCSRILATATVQSTITVSSNFTVTRTANNKREVTPPASIPTYAEACGDLARYASACSCFGITGSVVTSGTTTITVTKTATTIVSGSGTGVGTGSTSGVSRTSSKPASSSSISSSSRPASSSVSASISRSVSSSTIASSSRSVSSSSTTASSSRSVSSSTTTASSSRSVSSSSSISISRNTTASSSTISPSRSISGTPTSSTPPACTASVKTDPLNCGTCGNVCPSGVCSNGVCSSEICNAQTCGGFTNCNPNNTECFCFSSVDQTVDDTGKTQNIGFCGQNAVCTGLTPCVKTEDCNVRGSSGNVCAVDTCCGPEGICLVGQCGNPARKLIKMALAGSARFRNTAAY